MQKKQFTIYDFLGIILLRWKLFVILPIFSAIVAIAIGFFMPKWYRAEAQILPPYTSAGGSSLINGLIGGMMGFAGDGDFTLPFMVSPTDLWGAVLKTRGISDSIIVKFDLQNKYHKKNLGDTYKQFEKLLFVDISPEGIVTVGFEDKSPQLSAEITAEIVRLLDQTVRAVRTTYAQRNREYLENRLEEAETTLVKSENTLLAFQKKNRAISLEDQAKVAVENVASLYAQMSVLEVQIDAMLKSGAQYSPELQQLTAQSNEMRSKIKKLEVSGDDVMLGTPLQKYPDLILEYARLYREFKIDEMVFSMLKQQYIQAQLEENRNTASLNVISAPTPPDKKLRPKKALMALGAFAGTFVLLFVFVIINSFVQKLKTEAPEDFAKIFGKGI